MLILFSESRDEVCLVVDDKYYPFTPFCAIAVLKDGDALEDYECYVEGESEFIEFKSASDLKEVTVSELVEQLVKGE